ncbi:MAG: peroxiredoxin [Bdellovibrionales bacterium]|nr:peroxiredoxin [Bdellovibrionales bacterium]
MADSKVGSMLPEGNFKVTGADKADLNLPADLKGGWSLIYFYPKDDTPGCTKQACGYRDQIADFDQIGLKVYGVSLDDEASHTAFQDKFSLNFPLIVDSEKVLSEALGVYGEQTWNDQTFMGLSRDSFLIDPDGKVAYEWRKVNPTETVGETLDKAKSMMG